MRKIRLSICIPTYNFGEFIAETLDSILSQVCSDEVEVLVVDGASTDNTHEVVQRFVERYGCIKYHRLPAKGGIDVDLAKSVEFACGDYCWLFSSDDLMISGALKRVLSEIRGGHDIYLCRHTDCTRDMQIIAAHDVLSLTKDEVFDLSRQDDRRRYVGLAQTTEAFFSFMSTIIVKRARWCTLPINAAFIGSCWAHVARLFELIRTGLTLKYIVSPCVDRRGWNDSFLDQGVVNRFRIAIAGYHLLSDVFFGHDSIESFHIRRVVAREFTPRMFLYAKLLCKQSPSIENRVLLDSLVAQTYSDPCLSNLLKRAMYRSIPVWLYASIRAAYRTTFSVIKKRQHD